MGQQLECVNCTGQCVLMNAILINEKVKPAERTLYVMPVRTNNMRKNNPSLNLHPETQKTGTTDCSTL